jgi:hypothetical protein
MPKEFCVETSWKTHKELEGSTRIGVEKFVVNKGDLYVKLAEDCVRWWVIVIAVLKLRFQLLQLLSPAVSEECHRKLLSE